MESKGVIFEGKTLDDAVRKGLDALGLSRAEVMIQVMEEGSGGFLGIGSRPYKVRMMPRPRREMSERSERPERRGGRDGRDRDRGRGVRGSERGGRDRGERGDKRPRGDREGRVARAEPGARPERGGRPERERSREPRPERAAPPAASREEPAPVEGMRREEGGMDQGPRRRRRRRGRNGDDRRPQEVGSAPRGPQTVEADLGQSQEPHAVNGSTVPTDELVATGKQLAEDLFRAMGFEAQVSAHAEEDSVEVRAEIGKDSELITGEKGEVRQAIQHILNRMLNRGGTSRYHLQLEINDFWAQRETELRDMARRLADEAVADDSEKLTEYLNAQERRVIHVALRDDTRVRTFGLGDGLIKKIAISPAEAGEGQKPEE
jgi:spoIIIJ-associated protein